MKKRLATLVALPAALLIPAGAALAVSAGTFGAALHAVPHDHVADAGSNVTGEAALRLTGRLLDVRISAGGSRGRARTIRSGLVWVARVIQVTGPTRHSSRVGGSRRGACPRCRPPP